MTISDNAKQAMFAPQTDEAFIILITIEGEGLNDPIRVSSDPTQLLVNAGVRGTVSRGDEYLYLPVEINLPQQDDTGVSRATLSIDNIDRRVVEAARRATKGLSVTIEIVLSSDPDVVEASLPDFSFESVRYNAFTVTGDISIEYFDLEPFPSFRFTPSLWPGIF